MNCKHNQIKSGKIQLMSTADIIKRNKDGTFKKGLSFSPQTQFKKGQSSPRKGIRRPGWTNQTSFKGREDLWNKDPREYQRIHDWVKRKLGTPKFCEICKREDKNLYHWANKSRKYQQDINDWCRMCNNCHQRYDLRLVKIAKIADMILSSHFKGGITMIIGNGGSLSLSDHFAAELIGKFEGDKPLSIRSISLSSPTIITAIANDYGYENVFSRQIETMADRNSLLIVMTTSDYSEDGHNKNLWKALSMAKKKKCKVVLMCSEKTKRMNSYSNCSIRGVGNDTASVQNDHLKLIHLICRRIESKRWSS